MAHQLVIESETMANQLLSDHVRARCDDAGTEWVQI